MKGVVLCVNGITSSIFAAKMEKYCTANGLNWHFMSYKAEMFSDIAGQTDLVLLTPQAIYTSENVRQYCRGNGIACLDLEEEEFVKGDCEAVMRRILAAERTRQTKETKETKVSFSRMITEPLCLTAGIMAIAFLFHVLSSLLHISLLDQVYVMATQFICLFFLAAIGSSYGAYSGYSRRDMALLFIASYLICLCTDAQSILALLNVSLLFMAAAFSAFIILASEGFRMLKDRASFHPHAGVHSAMYRHLDLSLVFFAASLILRQILSCIF